MLDKNLFINKNEEKLFELVEEKLLFQKEIEDYLINFYEKERLPDLLGKTVRVTKNQFPKVNQIIEDICKILQMDKIDAYIFEDFYYGVESKGIKRQWLEISSKTVEDFNYEQLKFVIAKELYNIKFKNTYYSSMIMQGIKNYEKLYIPGMSITSEALKVSLYKWHRVMNFSSDNFGFVVTSSLTESINAILLTILNSKMLVSNVNIKEYILQANEINKLDDEVYNNTKLDELVPYGPYRVKNLIAYASSVRSKEAKSVINI